MECDIYTLKRDGQSNSSNEATTEPMEWIRDTAVEIP